MDATLLSNKAPPEAADAAAPSSAQQAAVEPSPSPGVKTSGGEDDDEQVEKFYALLDNIRAMRGMVGAGGTTATAAERKRPREAEPPWRPAFRMEDFELEEARSESDAPCCDANKKVKRESNNCGARRRPASERETMTGGEEEGEFVEAKDPHLARRKQARRAGVLAADS